MALCVVHLCRVGWPSVGGMESVIAGLAARQIEQGHRVKWVTLGEGTTELGGIEVVRLPRIGPRRYPVARGLGPALLGADLVHVHGIDGLADQVLGLAGRPPVGISTHGGYLHTRRQWWLKQLTLRSWTRFSLRRAEAVWFTSQADRRALAPAQLEGPVVPDGVDLSPWRGCERRPEGARLVVWGRVDRHKGIDDLLRALARCSQAVRVDILGRGAQDVVAELQALAASLGVADAVTWWGDQPVSKAREIMAQASWAVFPSRAEGFGLALVEAMAAGLPVLVRPIPAHCERVRDGVEGVHVDFDDPDAAARSLDRALTHADPTPLGEAARREAERWDWSVVGPRWDAAYARVLG